MSHFDRLTRRAVLHLANLPDTDDSPGILVIGAGCAGLSAANAARQHTDLPIVLVDEENNVDVEPRMNRPALFNAAGSESQLRLGIWDSPENHALETLRAGGGRGDPELVRRFSFEAAAVLRQLENAGCAFRDRPEMVPNGTYPRTHVTSDACSIRKVLLGMVREAGVTIRTGLRLSSFGLDAERRITGAVFDDPFGRREFLPCRAVVLATGGVAGDAALSARYDRRSTGLATTAVAGSQNHAFRAAAEAGAFFVGMNYAVYETGIRSRRGFVPFALHPSLYVLLDESGRRTVNESDAEAVKLRLLSKPNHVLWLVTSEESFRRSADLPDSVEAMLLSDPACYRLNGLDGSFRESLLERNGNNEEHNPNASAASGTLPFDTNALEGVLRELSSAADSLKIGKAKETGAKSTSFHGPLLVFPFTIARARTLGGVRIDREARVLDAGGRPIPMLYAAGDVTGGIHGNGYVPGNGLTSAIVFGTVAGRNAARGAGDRRDLRTFPL